MLQAPQAALPDWGKSRATLSLFMRKTPSEVTLRPGIWWRQVCQ